MKTHQIILGALVAIALIIGCKKDKDTQDGPSPVATNNPLRSYLSQNLLNATQTFTVTAAAGGTFQGARGSRVDFMPGAFVTASGAPVSGVVQIRLVEVLTIADMVLMNKQTLGMLGGTARMLKSGGEVKITATQGGAEVFIVPNGAIVSIPGSSVDPQMEVFYGTEDADGDLIWNLTTDSITITGDSTIWDTTGGNWFYYQFAADSLNWINCDYFPPGSVASIQVDTPDGYDGGNTMVWIVVPALNGMVGAWYTGGLFTSGQVPIGDQAVIVALHQDADDNYFSSFTTTTISVGSTVPIVFQPTTLAQFEAAVNAL